MGFKELIDKYLDDSDDMVKLTNKIDWFVDEVEKEDKELADKFLMKIDLLLNPHFTRETSKHVVDRLINKDGSKGGHWTYDQTTRVLENQGWDFHTCDWYYVLNMIYSDYYKSGRSDETYIELAKDFIDDIDAPDDKAKKYYLAMK